MSYDGFFEFDGGGNLVPKASLVGELDMNWELDGLGNLIPRATPLNPVFPIADHVRVPDAYGWAGEYVGVDVLPDPEHVENGISYGANGTEYTGTYGGSPLISATNIRDRIRDRSARAVLRIAQRLGFQFNFKAYESATAVTGLWAIDISSEEVRTIFGSNVDSLNRVIDVPRQHLPSGAVFPPANGFKVNCRIIIHDVVYGVDPNYATVDVQDAAVIRVVLRRWEYITMELDG